MSVGGEEPDWDCPAEQGLASLETTPVNTYNDSPHGTLDYVFVSPDVPPLAGSPPGCEKIDAAELAFNTPDRASPRGGIFALLDNAGIYPPDHIGLVARLSLA